MKGNDRMSACRAVRWGLLVGMGVCLWAGEEAWGERIVAPGEASVQAMPVYVPPARGAPGGRRGGAGRGPGDDGVMVSALAPDHTGLTGQEQPTLYWYVSKPTKAQIEFTLMDERSIHPRLEVRIGPPIAGGIQQVRLTDFGIRLEPGVKYEWTVAVVLDPARRSRDILAGGVIEHLALPAEVSQQLSAGEKTQAAYIYARAGYWYDAVAALSEWIEVTPNDPGLRKQRAALLEQVDLLEVAAFDKRAAAVN